MPNDRVPRAAAALDHAQPHAVDLRARLHVLARVLLLGGAHRVRVRVRAVLRPGAQPREPRVGGCKLGLQRVLLQGPRRVVTEAAKEPLDQQMRALDQLPTSARQHL